jgi:tetratricopeptide (TPR) repeat protein
VGSLPLWVKVIAALGGIRGSKERGIERLRRAAEQGKYANDDARVLLIAIYAREDQYQKALDLVSDLANRYPRNYYFPIEAANLLVAMGRKQEGFNAFEAMLQNEQFQEVRDFIHFQYAQTLSANGYNVAALHYYRKVTTMPEASLQLVTLAHLRIGQLLDLRGEREAAIASYKTVLSQDNVFDSHERAQQYLNKPFNGREE